MDIAKPQALGREATTASNPEQLFAVDYSSSCFNSALELVLEHDKVKVEKSEVTATISLITDKENGGVKLVAKLEIEIFGIEDELKEKYVQKAHEYCPYSKAVKN